MPGKIVHKIHLDRYAPMPAQIQLGTVESYGVEQIAVVAGAGWDGLDIVAVYHPPKAAEPVRVLVPSDGLSDVPPEATAGGTRFSTLVNDLKNVDKDIVDANAFCSALSLGGRGGTWTVPNVFTVSNKILYISPANITSLSELQQYLQQTPMSLTAILVTPIETPLTTAELTAYKALTTYAPDTVVQASDGAGVKLDYQRDLNLVVKNLEDAIASMTTT